LLSLLKVGKYVLRNRIVLPPMQADLATEEGLATEAHVKHYGRYARWCGLVIVEHTAVSPEGRYSRKQLGIWSDKHIPGLAKIAKAVHDEGGVVVIQLNHAGGKASREVTNSSPKAPSSVPLEFYPETPRELSLDEIESIIRKFGEAAERAYSAELDGVEIHGAHGFLLSQFWSPITNRRKDDYGGSLENRMRLPLEIVREVRDRLPRDFLLLYRLGVTDLRDDGVKVEESIVFAKKLEKEGVDIIDVSGGLCGSRPKELEGVQGYFIPYAHEVKKNTNIPIIGGGGIRDPLVADKFIREGKVDLVYVGRAQLEDPEWARKAIEILKNKYSQFSSQG